MRYGLDGGNAAIPYGRDPASREIGLLVIVCLDNAFQIYALAPFLVGGEETDTLFEMLMLGITL